MDLTATLKQRIRYVFEPKYNRQLSDTEIYQIADNLETVVEEILKLKWKQHYEKTI
jgi:hypothetical protein